MTVKSHNRINQTNNDNPIKTNVIHLHTIQANTTHNTIMWNKSRGPRCKKSELINNRMKETINQNETGKRAIKQTSWKGEGLVGLKREGDTECTVCDSL